MCQRIGIAVLGLGWMGQAHSRSALRIPSLFPDRAVDPVLVVCADTEPDRRARATADFGFERSVADWREAVDSPDVDAVWVTAPNMLHVPMIEAACRAGKAVFSDFTFSKKVDLSSPKLCLIAARGDHIKTAKLSIRKAGGAAGQVDYQVYDLEKIYVTGVQISGGEGGVFFETLTLAPTKFKWEYKQQADDGSLSGNVAVTVDRSANTAT